jgi:hypothetical protein
MKQRGGTKQNQKGMLNIFQSTFSRSEEKQITRIYICKTERTLQISGKCVQFIQSCLRTPPSYFCSQKQSRKINAMRRVSFKRAQRYLNIKYGEVSLQIESAALPPKPQSLYEMKMKR